MVKSIGGVGDWRKAPLRSVGGHSYGGRKVWRIVTPASGSGEEQEFFLQSTTICNQNEIHHNYPIETVHNVQKHESQKVERPVKGSAIPASQTEVVRASSASFPYDSQRRTAPADIPWLCPSYQVQ